MFEVLIFRSSHSVKGPVHAVQKWQAQGPASINVKPAKARAKMS